MSWNHQNKKVPCHLFFFVRTPFFSVSTAIGCYGYKPGNAAERAELFQTKASSSKARARHKAGRQTVLPTCDRRETSRQLRIVKEYVNFWSLIASSPFGSTQAADRQQAASPGVVFILVLRLVVVWLFQKFVTRQFSPLYFWLRTLFFKKRLKSHVEGDDVTRESTGSFHESRLFLTAHIILKKLLKSCRRSRRDKTVANPFLRLYFWLRTLFCFSTQLVLYRSWNPSEVYKVLGKIN